MKFNDELAQEITDRLRKGEVVVVVDVEHNHNDRALQILQMTLDDDAVATAHRVLLPNGGRLILNSCSWRSLEGLRFNLALVSHVAHERAQAVRTLNRSVRLTHGEAEVRYF